MSVLSIQHYDHNESVILFAPSVKRQWDIAEKSRPSFGLMMPLFEKTHCDPVSRNMPCESDRPWQYPEPRYGKAWFILKLNPVGKSKLGYFPLKSFSRVYYLTIGSFLLVLRHRF